MIAGIRNAMSDETDAAKLDTAIDSLAREYIKNRHLIRRKKYFAVEYSTTKTDSKDKQKKQC